MKFTRLIMSSLLAVSLIGLPTTVNAITKAAWTMLVYMAADNNLAPYATYNINDMSAGLSSTNGINVLVQWDKPNDRKTWRYKIKPGGKTDVGTLSSEMGYDPEVELVNSMQWAIKNYPADHFALILWDHGSGSLDFSPGSTRSAMDCMTLLNTLPCLVGRGILYDDSQQTCLTNQGLTNALVKIKQMLGKNLDLIAMDACLMAMVEVAYQMKGLVDTFVCSEQTIPGNGYPYSLFIKPLSMNPYGTTTVQLAQNMVASYKSFYSTQQSTPDFTLSALDVKSIDLIKQNIDQFLVAVDYCNCIDAAKTKNIIVAARKASISFEMPEYIDLYSFYANILNQTKTFSPKSALILGKLAQPALSPDYLKALTNLTTIILQNITNISKIVIQNVNGPVYSGAKGISIYYPTNGIIDPSYKKTLFAQNSSWLTFVQTYQ